MPGNIQNDKKADLVGKRTIYLYSYTVQFFHLIFSVTLCKPHTFRKYSDLSSYWLWSNILKEVFRHITSFLFHGNAGEERKTEKKHSSHKSFNTDTNDTYYIYWLLNFYVYVNISVSQIERKNIKAQNLWCLSHHWKDRMITCGWSTRWSQTSKL